MSLSVHCCAVYKTPFWTLASKCFKLKEHQKRSLCANSIDRVFGFYGYFFFLLFFAHLYCLVGCLSMIAWTNAVLGVLYACVSYFCVCTCSALLSMFHMERCSRNTLIIINSHWLVFEFHAFHCLQVNIGLKFHIWQFSDYHKTFQ